MTPTIASHALSDRIAGADSESRVADVLADVQNRKITHIAVSDGGRLTGLVQLQDILCSPPQRIFADLGTVPHEQSIREDTPLEDVARLINHSAVGAWPFTRWTAASSEL